MWNKIKIYWNYFCFCWKARVHLVDNELFRNLPNERPRLKVEIRNLTGKVKMNKRRGKLTKAQMLRLMFYEALSQSEEETFGEEMMYVWALAALWAIEEKE